MSKILYIRIYDEYYIGVEDSDSSEFNRLDTLVSAIKPDYVCRVLESIIPLWFKGKYYSTAVNYYAVMERAKVDSTQYIDAINRLERFGVLVKEKKRVYILGEGYYITTQKELNNDK